VGKVVTFDPKSHTVTLESGQVLSYERLLLATGTESVIPPIPGIEKEGVFTISKSMSTMTALREKVHQVKSVAIIDGGFIGAEFADELSQGSKADVHLIEIMPKLLVTAVDDEFCYDVATLLVSKGMHTHCGNRVADESAEVRTMYFLKVALWPAVFFPAIWANCSCARRRHHRWHLQWPAQWRLRRAPPGLWQRKVRAGHRFLLKSALREAYPRIAAYDSVD